MTEFVFVYGSLRRGESNHALIKDSVFVGNASIRAKNISQGRFYGIVDGDDVVHGEVYEVDEATMRQLDLLEGIDFGLYEKRKVVVDKGFQCWVYYYAFHLTTVFMIIPFISMLGVLLYLSSI